MPEFHSQAQTLDMKLVATISSILNSANVPNILWGYYLLTVYGVPTIVDVCISNYFLNERPLIWW